MTDGPAIAAPPRRHTHLSRWWPVAVTMALCIVLSLAGERATMLLRYERTAILAGEWWRLLSGHVVHLDDAHLTLNLAGLLVMMLLVGRCLSTLQWLGVVVASMATIDLGFVFYQPQLDWYVGLSGVLHGVLAAGIVASWRRESQPLLIALAVFVIAKLSYEQMRGALPLSGDMPVVTEAHLYGALGGAVAGCLVVWCENRFRRDE